MSEVTKRQQEQIELTPSQHRKAALIVVALFSCFSGLLLFVLLRNAGGELNCARDVGGAVSCHYTERLFRLIPIGQQSIHGVNQAREDVRVPGKRSTGTRRPAEGRSRIVLVTDNGEIPAGNFLITDAQEVPTHQMAEQINAFIQDPNAPSVILPHHQRSSWSALALMSCIAVPCLLGLVFGLVYLVRTLLPASGATA